MVVTMTTSGATLIKAGANVSVVISQNGAEGLSADEIITGFINQAESVINVATRFNWTDAYTGLNVDVKKILDDACSSLAAMYAIQYDMGNYTTIFEAQTMLDVHRDAALRGISILRDKKSEDFINGET